MSVGPYAEMLIFYCAIIALVLVVPRVLWWLGRR